MTKIGTESPLACSAPKSLPASGARGKPSHLSQASQTQHRKWRGNTHLFSHLCLCLQMRLTQKRGVLSPFIKLMS